MPKRYPSVRSETRNTASTKTVAVSSRRTRMFRRRRQIPKATVSLAGGKTLTVVANNLSVENKYVKSVTFNGRPLDKTIEHADLMSGGELVFEMTNAARR